MFPYALYTSLCLRDLSIIGHMREIYITNKEGKYVNRAGKSLRYMEPFKVGVIFSQ